MDRDNTYTVECPYCKKMATGEEHTETNKIGQWIQYVICPHCGEKALTAWCMYEDMAKRK